MLNIRMQRMTVRFLLFIGLFWGSGVVWAQRYKYESYTRQDGLLSDYVVDIAQTSEGRVWIATSAGVSSFDGLAFDAYADSACTFPVSYDTRIKAVDRDRLIMLGYSACLNYAASLWQGEQWMSLTLPVQPAPGTHHPWDAYSVNGKLIVYWVSDSLLYTYDEAEQQWDAQSLPVPSGAVQKVIAEPKLLLVTRNGLMRRTENGWENLTRSLASEWVESITDAVYDNRDGSIWLLGTHYLAHLAEGSVTMTDVSSKKRIPGFRRLALSSNGVLFFRDTQYFYWYNTETSKWRWFSFESDVNAANSNLLVDRENTLWITSYRGVHHISGFLFRTMDKSDGLGDSEVTLLKSMDEHRTLIGYKQGYNILTEDTIEGRYVLEAHEAGNMRMINGSIGPGGRLYVACQELGLLSIDRQGKHRRIQTPDVSIEAVNFIRDTLWVGSRTGDLYFLRDNRLIQYGHFYGYPRAIVPYDSNGLLIVGNAGVHVFTGKQVRRYTSKSLYMNQVYCLFEDGGTTYLGTGQGIARIAGDGIEPADLRGAPFEQPVYGAMTHNGSLWLGTDRGLYVFNDKQSIHYDQKDGLLGWDVNRGAMYVDHQGDILIGTNLGLNFFDPMTVDGGSVPLVPVIKRITDYEGNDLTGKSIRLEMDNSQLTIGIQAVSFSGRPVVFRYRMNGFESEWREFTSEDLRDVIYRNLPAGTLTFELQAKVEGGIWSESAVGPPIQVDPAFHQTVFFYLLLMGIAISIGYGINSFVSVRRRSIKLKREVDRQVSILRDQALERERIIGELEKTNQELDHFVYSVSHDLSAPVKSILGLVDLMKKESLTGTQRTYLELLERSIHKQDAFIGEIVDFARNARLKSQLSSFEPEMVITEVIHELSFMANFSSTQFNIHIDPGCREITGDKARFKIVLHNLVSNAIKFKAPYRERNSVSISISGTPNRFSMTISDEGIGIDKQHSDRLFTMFYKANDVVPGSGLGLFIAREAARKMGHEIVLESELGHGTLIQVVPHPG